MRCFGFVILVFLLCATAQARPQLIPKNQDPPFEKIVSLVLEKEKLSFDEILSWRKKVKQAAWLPKLYLGYDRSLKEASSINISDNISVTSSSVVVGPDEGDLDESINTTDVFRIRAVWSLDEIAFPSQTLNIHKEKRDLAETRQKIVLELFKLYTERKQLIAQYPHLLKKVPDKASIALGRIRSISDLFDYYTASRFHNQWWGN